MEDVSLRAAYLEDWMDTIEALPVELQRNFTLIRELDAQSQDVLRDIEQTARSFIANGRECSANERRELLKNLTESFSKALQHGESKVTLAVQTYDTVDKHIRRLDEDLMRFEDELLMTGPKISDGNMGRLQQLDGRKTESPAKKRKVSKPPLPSAQTRERKERRRELSFTPSSALNTGPGIPRRSTRSDAPPNSDLKKRVDSILQDESKRHESDPNEPTYCTCGQVSFGAMIACDNEDCDIEWFHYECVGLDAPPKGKWYCDQCTEKLGLKH